MVPAQTIITDLVGLRVEIRNEEARVVAALPADHLGTGYGVHPAQLGAGGQAAVNPAAFQVGVIGVG
jgi:hypothetical protein